MCDDGEMDMYTLGLAEAMHPVTAGLYPSGPLPARPTPTPARRVLCSCRGIAKGSLLGTGGCSSACRPPRCGWGSPQLRSVPARAAGRPPLLNTCPRTWCSRSSRTARPVQPLRSADRRMLNARIHVVHYTTIVTHRRATPGVARYGVEPLTSSRTGHMGRKEIRSLEDCD